MKLKAVGLEEKKKKKNIKGKRGSPDSASLDPLIALCDLDGVIYRRVFGCYLEGWRCN